MNTYGDRGKAWPSGSRLSGRKRSSERKYPTVSKTPEDKVQFLKGQTPRSKGKPGSGALLANKKWLYYSNGRSGSETGSSIIIWTLMKKLEPTRERRDANTKREGNPKGIITLWGGEDSGNRILL